MIDSSREKAAFTLSVLQQLRVTRQRYVQRGFAWQIPSSVLADMKRMSCMVKRYRAAQKAAKGTEQMVRYRHTFEEAQAESSVALWCLNQHNRLNGFPEAPELPVELKWLGRIVA